MSAAAASRLRIDGGRVLVGDRFETTSIDLDDGVIRDVGRDGGARRALDAGGLLVLPGIVDIHGDAFERQMMPRPGVHFALDIALLDTDRQVIANGITTVFHGVTWSWEPGLRGPENARAMLAAIEALRPRLGADTRFHLRHETYNLDAEAEVAGVARRAPHRPAGVQQPRAGSRDTSRPAKSRADGRTLRPAARPVPRAGRSASTGGPTKCRVRSSASPHAPAPHGVPLLSHDDASPEQRRWFRALGCRARRISDHHRDRAGGGSGGDDIVLGAPNVVRGGSHIGWINAKDMIARGLCSILASDYYYPAQLIAAFRLAADEVMPLEKAWSLISETAGRRGRPRRTAVSSRPAAAPT